MGELIRDAEALSDRMLAVPLAVVGVNFGFNMGLAEFERSKRYGKRVLTAR